MHQSPVDTLATEHQGHPQRPVLLGQAADRAVLPLHADQNDKDYEAFANAIRTGRLEAIEGV